MPTDFIRAGQRKSTENDGSSAALEVHAGQLELTVLFTELRATVRAFAKACELARGLNACIRLIVPQVVPYELALETPPVASALHERNLQTILETQTADARAEIFLCRDVDILLGEILPERSTVIVGGCLRWWPTAEELLARRLRKQGHEVIFAEPSEGELHHA